MPMLFFNISVYVITDNICDNTKTAYSIRLSQLFCSAMLYCLTIYIGSICNHLVANNGYLYWCKKTDQYKKDNRIMFTDVFYTDAQFNEKTRLARGIFSDFDPHSIPPIFILTYIVLLNFIAMICKEIFSDVDNHDKVILASCVLCLIQIFYISIAIYRSAIIDMYDLIRDNPNKYIKFSNTKTKIYNHICKSSINTGDLKYINCPKTLTEDVKNHITYLSEKEHRIIINDISDLTSEIIDMILDSKIKISYPYYGNYNTLTKVMLANFNIHQRSELKSEFINHYDITQNRNDTFAVVFNMKNLIKDAMTLLKDDNYVKIHSAIADFVKICDDFIAQEKEKTCELLINKGIFVTSKYLNNAVDAFLDDRKFMMNLFKK